jgi:SAM domain (Sterile alpha motif)
VQEIVDWLEKLGMPEYGECFAENKIDLSVTALSRRCSTPPGI